MLTKRQEHIIRLLNDHHDWMTGKEIAYIVGVSDRTIRQDMNVINQHYDCTLIQSNKRFGYMLDESLLFKQDIEIKETIPQTSSERVVWIIKELLFKNHEINLMSLQDQVFISGYSLEGDLKKVRKIISDYESLKLIRSKNHIYLEGDEEDKRKLYKHLLTEETKGNFMNLNSIAGLWNDFDLLEVVDVFEDVCDLYNYHLEETVFPTTMIHAGVAIERIIQHSYVIKDPQDYGHIQESQEYHISREFFNRVSQKIHIPVVEDEIYLFALLLIGKGDEDYRLNGVDQEMIESLVDKVISKINDFFDIDLYKDYDLAVGLRTHLSSLLERQRNKVEVSNMYLKEIKRKYPLVFEMAIHSGEVIQEELGYAIDENELAFLALHLGAAYERVYSDEKYRVIAIIPYIQRLSKPCLDKLRLRFDSRMEIVKSYSFFEEKQVMAYKPDLIITTVPLKHNLDVPTVQISLFSNNEDESKIFQALNLLDKQRYHDDFVKMIQRLLKKDLFHVHEHFQSSDEIIHALCDELIAKDMASQEYKEDVFKREAVSATSFAYGFAVPHSIEVSTQESCISTMILDKPVKWGDFEVRLVVLLSIRESDNHLLKIFFDWLCNIVTDSHKFAKLLEVDSHEEFMKLVVM